MPEEHKMARCYNAQCRNPLNHYSFSARINRHEHLWCTAACYVRWSREQAWTQRYTGSDYRAVLSPKRNYDERQIRPHSTEEAPKDNFPSAPIAVAVLAIVITTFTAFS
jgi:hypothetical protein